MAPALRRILAIAALVGLASCSAVYRNHGYVPPDPALSDIRVGVSDQDDVAEIIGRPTASGLLEESGWYYVQSRFRHFGLRAPEEIDREVVAISFTDAGTVSNVERFGLERGRVIALSRRVTDAEVQGVGFLQQLFGNIGNVDAASFLD
ncbi:outer membrane protein assembly factor BamE [Palleronia sp. LCG004]|uniref:outer membrane protein assembly factor BamE n=1 Tax=Palleronia sp. LCG004 TaxID=3079304 RepID=UPI002942B370|nr:outer membrane protein assembly factor BamE [Palleronia sp. LCG004]WOI54932.1 outer membrane protein assembly factor BamE [Palleronia sp. LCG004]